TGGAGVLGTQIAKSLGNEGIKVAILDIDEEAAKEVVAAIEKVGGTALGIKTNVLDKESLQKAEKIVREKLGPVDILINGAGGNHPKGTTDNEFLHKEDLQDTKQDLKTFFDLDQEGIEFVFNLNFLGTLLTSQVFTKNMIDVEGATIINVSSMNAFKPLTKIPAYSGAKAAVSNFTQWLAVHMSKVGIRVNAIAPGFFLTKQNRSLLLDENENYTERAQKIINQTPMERFGQPEELVGTILWLINEKAASFVNGVIVPIDGGFAAYSGV
ncbi:MAG TPA: SDR family oxidoreductase, partial [bacterium]|nr:SDR family oxidoreductase [bacterium]